jgi:hypothetical protein
MAWRELNKTWHDTTVDYCDVCGNLLIRRYWGFEGVDGEGLRACREDDERLYHTLRRYRAEAAATGVAADGRS